MILTEVGIEIELFLTKGNKVIEPSLFGFPSDEMGFLVELRSWHSDTPDLIIESLSHLFIYVEDKAESLGMKIERVANKELDPFFVDYLHAKYRYDALPDHTRNIHSSDLQSHHIGLIDNLATSGMHVHFSKREIRDDGIVARVLPLDIEKIVNKMDVEFRDIIAERNLGEYEPKIHGFEYRSLPCTADIGSVVYWALKILKEVE